MDEMTNGDAFVSIAEQGGSDALKLLGDLMDYNARQAAWAEEQERLGLEGQLKRAEDERDYWISRARKMEERILWLLGCDEEIPFQDVPFC